MELHVFIEITAPIPEAYMRMAHAMDEVKKFLIPVSSIFLQVTALSPCAEYRSNSLSLTSSQEPGEFDPYMDPQFLNGSQDGSGRGRGALRGRGGPPGAGGPRYELCSL